MLKNGKEHLLMAALLLFLPGCSKKVEETAEAPAPVQVTVVTQDTVRRAVSGDGVLFPRDQASVMPKIAAPVQRFLVQRGDHVRQGQLLAVLESRDLTATTAESKGQLDQAEANLRSTESATVPEAVVKAQTDVDTARQTEEAAKKLLDNRQKLFDEGALARKLVDDAQVAYAQAHGQYLSAQEHLRALQSVGKQEQIKGAAAQVESARAHLQSTQAQLGYTRIVSPISGVITDRPLYAGEMATPGSPLVTVMDISKVVARVNIPQSQATLIRIGHPAAVTQSDSGQQAEGKVTVVSPATDPNSTTIQVWVEMDNPGEKLKPGSSVHVKIVTETVKNAAVVPAAAILPGEEGGTAVIAVVDSVAHKKNVQIGVREGDKVQITNGVRPGEEVVIVGGMGVDDKAKVHVITIEEKKEADEEDAGSGIARPAEPKGGKDSKDQKKNEAKPKAK
jgi:HlyD family secretion protein